MQNVNLLGIIVFSSSVETRAIVANLKPFGIHIDISGTNFPFPPDSLHAPRTATLSILHQPRRVSGRFLGRALPHTDGGLNNEWRSPRDYTWRNREAREATTYGTCTPRTSHCPACPPGTLLRAPCTTSGNSAAYPSAPEQPECRCERTQPSSSTIREEQEAKRARGGPCHYVRKPAEQDRRIGGGRGTRGGRGKENKCVLRDVPPHHEANYDSSYQPRRHRGRSEAWTSRPSKPNILSW